MLKRAIAIGLTASMLTGCYSMTVEMEGIGAQPASVKNERVVRTINTESKGWFILGGLVPVAKPNFNEAWNRLADDERVEVSRVTSVTDPIDVLVYVGGIVISNIAVGVIAAANPTSASAMPYLAALIPWLMPMSRTMKIEGKVIATNWQPKITPPSDQD